MANVFAPFGFSPEGTVGGSTPNFRLSKRLIAMGYATAIFSGDAVIPVSTGYVQQATASTVPMAGIFFGCKYLSASQGRQVWSRYWPGSDAAADVTAYIIDDPQAVFMVQGGVGGPITLADVNLNGQLVVGTGSTLTGQSGMYLDMTSNTPAGTSTYPFTIVGLVQDPTGANGTDDTTAYNYALVTFNNQIFRAGITGV